MEVEKIYFVFGQNPFGKEKADLEQISIYIEENKLDSFGRSKMDNMSTSETGNKFIEMVRCFVLCAASHQYNVDNNPRNITTH